MTSELTPYLAVQDAREAVRWYVKHPELQAEAPAAGRTADRWH